MTIVEMLGRFGIPPLLSAVLISAFLALVGVIVIRLGSKKPVQAIPVHHAQEGQATVAAGPVNPQVIAVVVAAVRQYNAQVAAAISAAVTEYRKSI